MAKKSAGIVLYRTDNGQLEVLLVHPGGPFWRGKDTGAWSIPKGEFTDEEEPLAAAIREFHEETGTLLAGDFIQLMPIKQKSGKVIYAFALHQNLDVDEMKSNMFEMEWPPKSGKMASFPEIDKAGWFDVSTSKIKLNAAQAAFIEELQLLLFNNEVDSPI